MSPHLTAIMVVTGPSSELAPSLARARAAAEEVVVLDLSRDGRALSADDGVRVITAPRTQSRDISEAYRFAMSHATRDWVLVLRPNERVGEDFEAAWKEFDGEADAVALKIVSLGLDRPLRAGSRAPRRAARVFRRTGGLDLRATTKFEELGVRTLPKSRVVDFSVECRNAPLADVDAFLREADLQSDWSVRATAMRSSLPRLMLSPALEFLRSFFGRGGWKDGRAGFFLAWLDASSVFNHEMKLWVADRRRAEP